nr:hypothetical protein [uncultured Celeribacter sp.]
MGTRLAATDAKIAQLELLQTRLIAHGSRLWQLPFSYAGIVAVSTSLYETTSTSLHGDYVFYALGVAGFIVLYCMYGAYEGYARTADFMRNLEQELGLIPSTTVKLGSHVFPYFLLGFAATVATFLLGMLLV